MIFVQFLDSLRHILFFNLIHFFNFFLFVAPINNNCIVNEEKQSMNLFVRKRLILSEKQPNTKDKINYLFDKLSILGDML